jgi:hypothetical protein
MENPKCDLGLGTWPKKMWDTKRSSKVIFFIRLMEVRFKGKKNDLKT